MNKKHELKFMTAKEIQEAFSTNPVIIIPLGSMEVHGPHSPVGDFMAAEEIAIKAAAQVGAYVTPVVPFGNSEYFRGFSGTISIRNETLLNWVSDMVYSLVEHNITKILFLNGHAGNAPMLEELSRRFRREKGIIIPRMDIWQSIPAKLKEEVFGVKYKNTGHGGGTVDCVMQYLHPEAMRLDLYNANEEHCRQWQTFPMTGLGKTEVCGVSAFLPTNMEDISEQGSLGNADLGSPEGGKKILDWLIGVCVEFCTKIQGANMVL